MYGEKSSMRIVSDAASRERKAFKGIKSFTTEGRWCEGEGDEAFYEWFCRSVEEVSEPITSKVEKKESVVKMPTVVKPNSPVLTGWAAIAAKPAVEAERKVSVEVPPMTTTKKTTLSREYEEAMMGIDEKEEDRSSGMGWFDWGEEAMN